MKREYTDDELLADIKAVSNGEDPSIEERNAYFADPSNADTIKMQQERMDLVIALHKARKEAGLTQQQLAEKLGITQEYIAQIEKGRKNVTFATIIKFAHACGKRIAVSLL